MKRSFIILLYLFGLYCNGQVVNIVKIDSITSDLHQSNLGRIIFMNRNIPLSDCTEADFLTTFQLKKDCDLNIRVFMTRGKSMCRTMNRYIFRIVRIGMKYMLSVEWKGNLTLVSHGNNTCCVRVLNRCIKRVQLAILEINRY